MCRPRLATKQCFRGKNPQTGEREIYYFGIIDCLTRYVLKKKLAYACKRLLWKPETLSTVHPDFYAKRFYTFMTEKLVSANSE